MSHLPFAPGASFSLAVSGTTSSVQITGSGQVVRLHNSGTTDCFVKFGGSTVEAATTDMSFPAGAIEVFQLGAATYIAAITASGTTTLKITRGEGI